MGFYFFFRGGPMDFSCASCHGVDGQRIRMALDALLGARRPTHVTARSPREKVQQRQVPAQHALLSVADLPMFVTGLVFSFLSAWLCVRWLLRYISTHSFVPFAYYRIVFGVVVLVTAWTGWVQWAG